MKRAMLILLSLVLVLGGWSAVGADDGFYVITGMRAKYAPVPKTGQTDSYGYAGTDGALQKGVASPTPRFTDNNNGTVTDNLTGLIWMKNASNDNGASGFGPQTWAQALSAAATLANGSHDLTDGSKAGDWRLPNLRELLSLVDYGQIPYALPAGHPFVGVQGSWYWSSTTYNGGTNTGSAWYIYFNTGDLSYGDKTNVTYVWCVRGGK